LSDVVAKLRDQRQPADDIIDVNSSEVRPEFVSSGEE